MLLVYFHCDIYCVLSVVYVIVRESCSVLINWVLSWYYVCFTSCVHMCVCACCAIRGGGYEPSLLSVKKLMM